MGGAATSEKRHSFLMQFLGLGMGFLPSFNYGLFGQRLFH
jgi:hypothetical protein